MQKYSAVHMLEKAFRIFIPAISFDLRIIRRYLLMKLQRGKALHFGFKNTNNG